MERSFKSVTSAANSGFIPFHICPTLWLLSCDQFSSHLPPMGKAIAGERSEARLLYPQSPPHHRKIKIIKKDKKGNTSITYWGRMWGTCKGPTSPEHRRRSPWVAKQKAGKNLTRYNPKNTQREEDLISRNQPNVTHKRKHESSKTKSEGCV